MVIALVIAAIFEAMFGFGAFINSKSAIHEILGILALGFSVLTFGLASILNELERQTSRHATVAKAVGTAAVGEALGAR